MGTEAAWTASIYRILRVLRDPRDTSVEAWHGPGSARNGWFDVRVLVTGAAGFIGSAVVRRLVRTYDDTHVFNLDKLTYASSLEAVEDAATSPRYTFERADICDRDAVADIFARFAPDIVMHLAAESHVDRSIDGPAAFIEANIVGTYILLEVARAHWLGLEGAAKQRFRFHHVSTDEVYGSLGPSGAFTEESRYQPNSPYSASKASADHLVRAWHETFGLPVVITNCSNNYGPYQYPEKLIPVLIMKALAGAPLSIYGKGDNVRDWLYVEDHAEALCLVATKGRLGETYNIGGNNECTNLELAHAVCALLDECVPQSPHRPHASLITFVTDRPGHDQRYAIDAIKIRSELGWTPRETFDTGIRKTVEWYLANQDWCRRVVPETQIGLRQGLAARPPEPALSRA